MRSHKMKMRKRTKDLGVMHPGGNLSGPITYGKFDSVDNYCHQYDYSKKERSHLSSVYVKKGTKKM